MWILAFLRELTPTQIKYTLIAASYLFVYALGWNSKSFFVDWSKARAEKEATTEAIADTDEALKNLTDLNNTATKIKRETNDSSNGKAPASAYFRNGFERLRQLDSTQ